MYQSGNNSSFSNVIAAVPAKAGSDSTIMTFDSFKNQKEEIKKSNTLTPPATHSIGKPSYDLSLNT